MSLGTFNPETAYANSWQYVPAVKTILFKRRDTDGELLPPGYSCRGARADLDGGDYSQFGGLLHDPKTTVWHVWAAGSGAPQPQLDDNFEIEGVNWIVRGVMVAQWGPEWVCACVEEVVNRG